MLEKKVFIDLIDVIENGCVRVRICNSGMEEGKQISATFQHHIIAPGDDYSGEDAKVQAVCARAHTPEIIAKYMDLQASKIPA